MGWTYSHKPVGYPIKKFFEERFNYSHDDGCFGKVLLCKTHTYLRVSYMAYQIGDKEGKSKVIALVCLIGFDKTSYCNFGYKDMDENMGPSYYDCPKDILDLLTRTDNDTAKAWRQACRKRNDRSLLRTGDVIRFARPVHFENDDEHSIFVSTNAKKGMFESRGKIYKLTRRYLRSVKWEVLNPMKKSPEELPLLLGLHPRLDIQIERRLRPPDPAPKCPASKQKCEDYEDCHNRNYCHLK